MNSTLFEGRRGEPSSRPPNKTLLSPPLLIRLSFRVARFSRNHFFAEKIKKMRQSVDTSWEKALKKDDFFEYFRIPNWRIVKKKSKKVDFFKKVPQDIIYNSQKSIDP